MCVCGVGKDELVGVTLGVPGAHKASRFGVAKVRDLH